MTWGGGEVHTRFWWGIMGERDNLEDIRVGLDGRIILKWSFKEQDKMWTGLIWLRIRTSGEHL